MYVYICGPGHDGPCKIGSAGDPDKRLRGLQTGSSQKLALLHVEPVVAHAATVERAAHRRLSAWKSDGGSEWFNVPLQQARSAVRSAAVAANVAIEENSTVQQLYDKALAVFIEELGKREDERARLEAAGDEVDDFEDDDSIVGPDIVLEILAQSAPSPALKKFTFNDFLLSTETGMWMRWTFERLGRRMPNGIVLKPYLDAAAALPDVWQRTSTQGPQLERIEELWLTWSGARALTSLEATCLADVWNEFVPRWNQVDRHGPQWLKHGIDDHVDDVHLCGLVGDSTRGDRDKVVFRHKKFRAVLIPTRPKELSYGPLPHQYAELQPFGQVPVVGFVTPVADQHFWNIPIRPWLREAPAEANAALSRFIGNPDKKFPRPRAYDGTEASACSICALPKIDAHGCY